jgi:mannitol 2-dehydrogenase
MPSASKLTNQSLRSLHGYVAVPRYERTDLATGIVHFGVGGFHRSHEAMYVDRLLNQGTGAGWAICGVGTLPSDRAMQRALDAQDCLYTLVLKDTTGSITPQVIGSIARFLHAADAVEPVITALTDPLTRIISLTITEGGYPVSNDTGDFAPSPELVADVARGAGATTVFGLVAEALDRRRTDGGPGVTIVSCDNMTGNGDIARRSFTGVASLRSPELATWMQDNVEFPNSMVDRITPVTTDTDRRELTERFDIDDAWPVVAEPFVQWVLEDRFVAGRPPLEDVGVQFVSDVHPYELMKLRLLNASHQVLTYLGYLAGYRYVHEVCEDPAFRELLLRYMVREATPTLPAVPGIDLDSYRRTLIERFTNPHVGDSLARNGTDGSDRIPKFVLPVVREQLASGGDISVSVVAVAAWARYLDGVDEQGRPIDVADRRFEQLGLLAAQQRTNPEALLTVTEVFGDLGRQPQFVTAYRAALASLYERGARATVAALLE